MRSYLSDAGRKAEHQVTIREAVEAFFEDECSRHLANTTTRQSKTLLQDQRISFEKCVFNLARDNMANLTSMSW
jgi:hypothetical protein